MKTILNCNEIEGLISAYKTLLVTRNAMIAQVKRNKLADVAKRLTAAQKADWVTVGELRAHL